MKKESVRVWDVTARHPTYLVLLIVVIFVFGRFVFSYIIAGAIDFAGRHRNGAEWRDELHSAGFRAAFVEIDLFLGRLLPASSIGARNLHADWAFKTTRSYFNQSNLMPITYRLIMLR